MNVDYITIDDFAYCALCDKYFPDAEKRREHIEDSPKHPECQVCGRRFLNRDILRKHYATARRHHYCVPCEKAFRSAAGYRVHLEYAAMHRCESDSEPEEEFGDDLEPGWEDLRGEDEFPDEVSDIGSDNDGENPLDSWAHKPWEDRDECDFEDMEDLGDPPLEFGAEEEADDEDEDVFTCPMCRKPPRRIGCTPCGHTFCVNCLKNSYHLINACPACEQKGSFDRVRRIYVS